ncbi:MAG: hypothetical protein Q7S13_06830 [Candidatus Omnitrophota bacterium]|nr:hypothetical protein [Candidatus Omnitrophota bacterium]
MGKRILLILSGNDRFDNVVARLKNFDGEAIFISPFDYHAEALARRLLEILPSNLSAHIKVFNFLDRFNQDAFQVKHDYINFIRDLGQREFVPGVNLRQYFRYPKENFSVWWFSLVSEKNPYKTQAFTIFSKAVTILRLKSELECDTIWMSSQNSPVYESLHVLNKKFIFPLEAKGKSFGRFLVSELKIIVREAARVGKFIFLLLQRILDARRLSKEFPGYRQRLEKCRFAAITAFPSIDQKRMKENKFVNLLYGPLQTAIESFSGEWIAWFGMYAPIHSSSWKNAMETAKDVKPTTNFFLLEEWLSFKDWLKIIRIYLCLSFRCLKKINRFRRNFLFSENVTKHKIDLWPVLRDDFLSSFLGKILIEGITQYITFEQITKELPPKSKVIYFSEIHGWEKALNVACAKREDIQCIGLQHTIVPLLYMNYFDHPDDLRGDDWVQYSPMPDSIGCVGKITRDILSQSGIPEERLFHLGAFRFQKLANHRSHPSSAVVKKNCVIVALSNCAWESEEILWLLYDAFNNSDFEGRFFIKSHPCCPAEKIINNMQVTFNSRIFEFTNQSLDVIVPSAKAMIVKESSSIFWALHYKIPVVVPKLYKIVDLCPLSGIRNDIVISVSNANDLFSVISDIIGNCNHHVCADEYDRLLDEYLTIYPNQNQYYDNLSAVQSLVKRNSVI